MFEKPVIIKDKLKRWRILSYQKKDWCNAFQGQVLRFRKGYKTFREDPYWEQQCEELNITINDFFDISKTEDRSNFWLYFDYKYMKDVLPENSEILKEVKWSDFGLNNLSGADSTIWIGNSGAHTPCHMDSYGCNFVAQVVGRKLWILIPPDESDSVHPVRVPYEESSIYSSYNFYTPTFDLLGIKNCYKIILNPGDLLFIPKHWWHYVENLELAVSVNVWIPQESDHEDRLQEALVRQYVSNLCQGLSEEEAKALLNPNEYKLLTDPFEEANLKLFAENCKKFRKENRSDNLEEFEKFLTENASDVPPFPGDEINKFIQLKSQRHEYQLSGVGVKCEKSKQKYSIHKILIDSYCHPRVVALIKERLTENL